MLVRTLDFEGIVIFIRSMENENFFSFKENFSFVRFLLLLHFYRNCISILLHAIALALSLALDYSWTRLDCNTENSDKMELEEFRMKNSFDKLSSRVHCEIWIFFFFFFFLHQMQIMFRDDCFYTESVHYIKSVIHWITCFYVYMYL